MRITQHHLLLLHHASQKSHMYNRTYGIEYVQAYLPSIITIGDCIRTIGVS